jgi:ATP-dependent Clp protease ATP-binding subunit ClpC
VKWLAKFFKRKPRPSDNYTVRAQKLLILARKQADRLHHGYVGTDHLLLGLIELKEGIGFTTLQKLGLNPAILKQEIETRSGTGKVKTIAPTIPMTPRAKSVLTNACKEASESGRQHVGTEHILLGLVRVRAGIAAEVLKSHGVDLAKTRDATRDILQRPPMAQGENHPTTTNEAL